MNLIYSPLGGTLRRFRLEGSRLHADDDARGVTVLTDDERPAVFYGDRREDDAAKRREE